MKKHIISAVTLTALVLSALLAPSGTFAQGNSNKNNNNNSNKNHNNKGAPVITGITAPTVLNVDQAGTWTIHASDPENGNLTYSVDWGETGIQGLSSLFEREHFVQTATFTHSYETPGVKTIKFTVRDESGKKSVSTVTVHVRNGSSGGNNEAIMITDLKVNNIRSNRAVLSWDTNIRTSSMVWLSTASPIDTSTTSATINRQGKTKKHVIPLNHLNPGTTYYIVVKSTNGSMSTTSMEISFTTPGNPRQTPTIVSIHGPQNLMTDQVGTWTIEASDPRNQDLSYMVDWGDSGMGGAIMSLFGKSAPFVQTTTFTHSYEDPGTYTITFTVKNESGQTAKTTRTVSVSQSTTTDTTGPVISNVRVSSLGTNQATVMWNTDEASNSYLYFGTTTPVVIGATSTMSVSNTNHVTSHSLQALNLASSTTYYFIVRSADAFGNMSTSTQFSTTTRSQ